MKKNYEVLVKAFAIVLVEGANDEDEALEVAAGELAAGDYEFDEATIEKEATTELELTSARRFAKRVIKL